MIDIFNTCILNLLNNTRGIYKFNKLLMHFSIEAKHNEQNKSKYKSSRRKSEPCALRYKNR